MPSIIDDSDIQALVDGELEPEEARHVRRAIKKAPELQERYEELRKQKDLIRRWWQTLH